MTANFTALDSDRLLCVWGLLQDFVYAMQVTCVAELKQTIN